MDFKTAISKIKEQIEKTKYYKSSKEYIELYGSINDYLLTVSDLYEEGKLIQDGHSEAFKPFLNAQLKELKLRKALNDAEIGKDLNEIFGQLKLSEYGYENLSKINSFEPNMVFNIINSLSKDLLDIKALNLAADHFIQYENLNFLEANDNNIKYLSNAINDFNRFDNEDLQIFFDKLTHIRDYTNHIDEIYLTKYVHENTKTNLDEVLGTDERTKAYIIMLSKIAKDMGDELGVKDLVEEFRKNNPDPEADKILEKISKMDTSTIQNIYSQTMDLGIDVDILGNLVERSILKHYETVSNMFDKLHEIDAEDVQDFIELVNTSVDTALDSGLDGGSFSAIRWFYKAIPDSLKERIPVIKEYEAAKKELKEKILNSELIESKINDTRKWIEDKVGIIAVKKDTLISSLGNETPKSTLKIMINLGKQDEELNKAEMIKKIDKMIPLKNNMLYDEGAKEPDQRKLQKIKALEKFDYAFKNDVLKSLSKDEYDYIISIISDNKTPDLEKLTSIYNKIEIDKDFYNIKDFIGDIINDNKYNINNLSYRIERELFVEFLLAQIDKPSVPDRKKELYIESFIGKNQYDISQYYSSIPNDDFKLKLTFLDQAKKDIQDRLSGDKKIEKSLHSNLKNSLETIEIMKNIISLDEIINNSNYIFTNESNFEEYLKKSLPIPQAIHNEKLEKYDISKELIDTYNEKILILKNKFENKIYSNDIEESDLKKDSLQKVINQDLSYFKDLDKENKLLSNSEIRLFSRNNIPEIIQYNLYQSNCFKNQHKENVKSNNNFLKNNANFILKSINTDSLLSIGDFKDVILNRPLDDAKGIFQYLITDHEDKNNSKTLNLLFEDKEVLPIIKQIIKNDLNDKEKLLLITCGQDPFYQSSLVMRLIEDSINEHSTNLLLKNKRISDIDPFINKMIISIGYDKNTLESIINYPKLSLNEQEKLSLNEQEKLSLIEQEKLFINMSNSKLFFNEILKDLNNNDDKTKELEAIKVLNKHKLLNIDPLVSMDDYINLKKFTNDELLIISNSYFGKGFFNNICKNMNNQYRFDNKLDLEIMKLMLNNNIEELKLLDRSESNYQNHKYINDSLFYKEQIESNNFNDL